MSERYEILRCLNCWLEVGLFIHLSAEFTTDTSVINTTVYPSFPWLQYWYQCYQYDSLTIFPLTSLLIATLSKRLFIHLSPDFTLIPALSIRVFIHLSSDFTIDTSVINSSVYPSFPWIHYWYQCYQYDSLSIFPLTSPLIPALSIRLFIHISPCLHYWYPRLHYDSLSIFSWLHYPYLS